MQETFSAQLLKVAANCPPPPLTPSLPTTAPVSSEQEATPTPKCHLAGFQLDHTP